MNVSRLLREKKDDIFQVFRNSSECDSVIMTLSPITLFLNVKSH